MSNAVKPARPDKSGGRAFYRAVIRTLTGCQIPFLLGGGHALEQYTGIGRDTKDLDIFIRRAHLESAFEVLSGAGYPSELSYPHWLAKVCSGDRFVDLIFSSGNGICTVDDDWFKHAVDGEFFDLPVKLCPLEEMIWCKAFIMERERYDGADVVHLLRTCGARIDWPRLLARFDKHWRVLLSHAILFDYIYPSEPSTIPAWVVQELLSRLHSEKALPPSRNRVCQGTLLSRIQYRADIDHWGYQDARQLPTGPMTPEQAAEWTAAANCEPKPTGN
jgi:hypothetical protein